MEGTTETLLKAFLMRLRTLAVLRRLELRLLLPLVVLLYPLLLLKE